MLEVSSLEGNALQMFVKRLLSWQDRWTEIFASSELKPLVRKKPAEWNASEVLSCYESMSSLRKGELENIFVESLLLETECDEKFVLNEFCGLVNNSQSVFETLKIKLANSSAILIGNEEEDGLATATGRQLSKFANKEKGRSSLNDKKIKFLNGKSKEAGSSSGSGSDNKILKGLMKNSRIQSPSSNDATSLNKKIKKSNFFIFPIFIDTSIKFRDNYARKKNFV